MTKVRTEFNSPSTLIKRTVITSSFKLIWLLLAILSYILFRIGSLSLDFLSKKDLMWPVTTKFMITR